VSAPEVVRPWLAELGERGPLVGATDADVLRSVRGYLAASREHLAELHRSSRSGTRVNGAHADLMDRLVRRLFQIAESEHFAEAGRVGERAAILAVGGYARREMSLHSDVDLLLLHEGAVTPYVRRLAERIQLWLWDAGLTVGCATRTVNETIELARDRLLRLQARVVAMRCHSLRMLTCGLRRESPGVAALVTKLAGCEVSHQIAGLAIDALGERGVLFGDAARARVSAAWQTHYMFSLGLIIGGGTAQIQKNIIAERGLGMPREPRA